jgi:ribosomal protein S7
MLSKSKKNISNKYFLVLDNSQFEFFLVKFCGSLISRGRKDYAMKLFDDVLFTFKKHFNSDPFVNLRKSINNLVPVLGSTQKRVGKVYHSVPKLISGKKKFVIMLSWIIKKQKGKSNVMGFKINDISRNLIDAFNKKGVLINLKRQHLASSLAGRHLLYTHRRRFFRKNRLRSKKRVRKKFFYLIKKTKYSRRR